MDLGSIFRALSNISKPVGGAAAIAFPLVILAEGMHYDLPDDWKWLFWFGAFFFPILSAIWLIEFIAIKLEVLSSVRSWWKSRKNRDISGASQDLLYALSLKPSETSNPDRCCSFLNDFLDRNYSKAEIMAAVSELEDKGLVLRSFQFGDVRLTDDGVRLSMEIQSWFEQLDIKHHKL